MHILELHINTLKYFSRGYSPVQSYNDVHNCKLQNPYSRTKIIITVQNSKLSTIEALNSLLSTTTKHNRFGTALYMSVSRTQTQQKRAPLRVTTVLSNQHNTPTPRFQATRISYPLVYMRDSYTACHERRILFTLLPQAYRCFLFTLLRCLFRLPPPRLAARSKFFITGWLLEPATASSSDFVLNVPNQNVVTVVIDTARVQNTVAASTQNIKWKGRKRCSSDYYSLIWIQITYSKIEFRIWMSHKQQNHTTITSSPSTSSCHC